MQRNWQASEIARIRQLAPTGFLPPAVLDQLSRELDRTPSAIRTQRSKLDLCRGNKPPKDWLNQFHPTQAEVGSRDGRPTDDGSFAAEMLKAVRAGTEKPPMIGINMRPSTKRPGFVSHRRDEPATENVLAKL